MRTNWIIAMRSSEKQAWYNAAIAFSQSLKADIVCPTCLREKLKAHDIWVGSEKVERRIYCPFCGKEGFIKLSSADLGDFKGEA